MKPNRTLIQYLFVLLWMQPFVLNASTSSENVEQQPKFPIWEIQVAGNSVLSQKQIESAVYGYLGPDKSFQDVKNVQQALGEIYREEGYSFASVTIPEQSVEDGIVQLKVVEGRLGRVRVTGNKFFSRKDILENVPSLTPGKVPQIDEIQKDLALLNRSSTDRTITPLAKPGKKPETVDIELKVKDALPLQLGADFNGRNSPETTRTRFGINLGYGNLWQKQHSVSMFYQTTPEDRDEVEVLGFFYNLPLWWNDSRLSLYYIGSDSDVATVGDVSVLGQGRIRGLRASFPFFDFDDAFHQVSFGLESKDFDQTAVFDTASAQDTPIDYTAFSVDYGGRLQLQEQSSVNFGAGFRSGLRGFGNSAGEFDRKRVGSRNNYNYFVGNLGYQYQFENEMRFRSRMNFQVTGEPLIGNEQYSAGGQFSVRGYLTSQELADEGWTTNFELWSPEFSSYLGVDFITNLTVLGFFDYAKLHNREVVSEGRVRNISLAGTGVGMRLGFFDYYSLNLDFARALSDSSEGEDSVDEGDWRVHFGLSGQY